MWAVLLLVSAYTVVLIEGSHMNEYYDNFDHFHCERQGQNCLHDGYCYPYDGNCDCSFGLRGFNCAINMTDYPDDDRQYENCPCLNTGDTCYLGPDGRTRFCSCPPDFFGEDCSKNRVKLECRSDAMRVAFNPILPFSGIVYLGTEWDDEYCRIHNNSYYGDDSDYPFTGHFDFYFDNPCNFTVSTQFEGGVLSNKSYTTQMTIQYDPWFQAYTDLILNLTCVHLEDGTWATNINFGVDRTSSEVERGKEIEAAYFPAKLRIKKRDYNSFIGNTVLLGQRLELVNYLTENDIYSHIAVDSCTISSLSGEKSIKIIEDGCPTDRSYGMALENPEWTSWPNQGIEYGFRAIRFGDAPDVKISCSIRLCKEDDNTNNCDWPDCGSNDRRKRDVSDFVQRVKRQAINSGGKQDTVYETFRVMDPYEENEQAFQEASVDQCLDQPVVKSVGVSLIAITGILVLVCIGLALCLCRARFRQTTMALELRYLRGRPKPENGKGIINDSLDDFKMY